MQLKTIMILVIVDNNIEWFMRVLREVIMKRMRWDNLEAKTAQRTASSNSYRVIAVEFSFTRSDMIIVCELFIHCGRGVCVCRMFSVWF